VTCMYNEHDPYAARWLRNLIAADMIAPGVVDERSIVELGPDDVAGATQFHAFGGIGGWSYALRLAGWPDDREIWSGSCPCQPFSPAGRKKGFADERHLWPAWYRLIRECRPVTVFGEQVGGRNGIAWLDTVQSDLERIGYTVGACVLPAAGFGAPHQRHRIFFVADAGGDECRPWRNGRADGDGPQQPAGCGAASSMVNPGSERSGWHAGAVSSAQGAGETERRRAGGVVDELGAAGATGELEHADARGLQVGWAKGVERTGDGLRATEGGTDLRTEAAKPGPANEFWANAEWLYCRDGKYRAAEPGLSPLAERLPTRMGPDGATETQSRTGMLRGYGNAIVPQVAAAFIAAYMAGAE